MGGSVSPTGDLALKALDHLEHHGVKGMHWGVHKDKAAREPTHNDAERAHHVVGRARVSGTGALSNQDLQLAINRLNLERQFNQVKPLTRSERAKKWIAQTLLKIGQEQASTLARQTATDQIKKAMKQA
jgi:hypothetical protein